MFSLLAFALAVFVCVQLFPAGLSKFDTTSGAVETFSTLGGDKVRQFVGVAEILGPILLFSKATTPLGFLLIAPVMLGATYLHVRVWKNSPKNALTVLAATTLSVIFRFL